MKFLYDSKVRSAENVILRKSKLKIVIVICFMIKNSQGGYMDWKKIVKTLLLPSGKKIYNSIFIYIDIRLL